MATEAWEKRVQEGRPHHGLGHSEYLPDNVQHLVSPIVGMLRYRASKNEPLTESELEYIEDRLVFVLELAREAENGEPI